MRINAINNFNSRQSFNGIVKIDEKAVKEIFGKRYDEFETLSNAKDVNIIPLRDAGGCAVKKATGYIVMIQGHDGRVVKKFQCASEKQEAVDALNKRIEECLIWAEADTNYYAASTLRESDFAKEFPDYTNKLVNILYATAQSQEARIWRQKIDNIDPIIDITG